MYTCEVSTLFSPTHKARLEESYYSSLYFYDVRELEPMYIRSVDLLNRHIMSSSSWEN